MSTPGAMNVADPLICSRCGSAMNHHADKLVDPASAEDAAQADPVLGGIIEEVHQCPGCGTSASRRHGGDREAPG